MNLMSARVLAIIAAILAISGLCVWLLLGSFTADVDPAANGAVVSLPPRQANYMCEADPRARTEAIRQCAMPTQCKPGNGLAGRGTDPRRTGPRNPSALQVDESQCVQPTDACLAHVQPDIRRLGKLSPDTFIAVLQQKQPGDPTRWQVTTTRPSDGQIRTYLYEPCGGSHGEGMLRENLSSQQTGPAPSP